MAHLFFAIPFSHTLFFSLQVKSEFTRTYNKKSPCLPYSVESIVQKRKQSIAADMYDDSEEMNGDSSSEDDVSKDPMVKRKKTQTKPPQATGSRVNGRGRGRGKAAKK